MANNEHHEALARAGMPVDGLSDDLKRQVDKLSAEEVKALVSIKAKLNAGLAEKSKKAADTVGGFVW
jgi:hypothetical protein